MTQQSATTPWNAHRGKVGRRISLLFISCALLPLAALAGFSVSTVYKQLHDQSRQQQQQATKSASMTLIEHLQLLDLDLSLTRQELRHATHDASITLLPALEKRLRGNFSGVACTDLQGAPQRVLTHGWTDTLELDDARLAHLKSGKSLLLTTSVAGPGRMRVALVQAIDPQRLEGGLLVGLVNPNELWDHVGVRPIDGTLMVVEGNGKRVFDSTEGAGPVHELRRSLGRGNESQGNLTWTLDDQEHVATYRRLFMKPTFMTDWIVLLSRPTEAYTGPLRSFERVFFLVTLLSFLTVAMLSLSQVRRMLTPISELHRATQRVSHGDFTDPVRISSRDEFEDLGNSFNQMTSELLRNIEQREETERQLVRARDAALAAAKTEAEFVTNVSHELRTPLTSIQSFAELLNDYEDEDLATRREFTHIIVKETGRLSQLIDEILQVSTMQTGALQLAEERVDVHAGLLAARDLLDQAQRKRIAVAVEPKGASTLVLGDPGLLQQVWFQLLENATNYSHADTPVTVLVTAEPEQVVVAVTDRGKGIPPELHERVFERFFQGSSDQLTAKNRGTGLGLALARDITVRHGGRIDLDSAPGRGSTFTVTLPALQPAVAAV
ncbi:MAG: HAMP domain-containing histidine kinase [Planctomycetes bacterium]|nr:HAMP domain-containing histidine kinase [Planctomycetota bacterium]